MPNNNNDQNNLSACSDNDFYKPEGQQLKDWWQRLLTPPAKTSIVFLISSPALLIIAWYIDSSRALIMLPIFAIVYLIVLLLLLDSINHQLRYICEITKSDTGMEVRSLFFHKKINWKDIVDFFPIQDGEYLLLTKNDEFFLAGSLLNNSGFIDSIQNHISVPIASYDWSHRIPQYVFDGAKDAGIAVIIALICSLYTMGQSYIAGKTLGNLHLWDLPILVLFLIVPWLMWVQVYKSPSLIRVSNTDLFLRLGSRTQSLKWEQIKSIKNLHPNLFLIRSDLGWFVLPTGFVPQKNNLNKLLHARKEQLLLSQNRPKID